MNIKPLDADIMVVEDDAPLRDAICDTLELAGARVIPCEHAEQALQRLAEQPVDAVVTDVNMPGMDGFGLLRAIQASQPQLPVLLMTAYGSIGKSVEAMRTGAVDYLVKPFPPAALIEALQPHVGVEQDSDDPVAEDAGSRQVLALARRVAATDSTVLICGESGTGKEVLARFIHRHSPRAGRPFVAINCAAIPESMLEATLFGHEKGSFTGAHQSAPGKFEQANGGTLLLDEISEMDVGLQAKLLRVIQEREVERVGGRAPIPLDVRIIATTNRQLRDDVAAGRFREDLFYRLSVFPLGWRPLRERRADIVPIAQRLLVHHAAKMHRSGVSFDATALAALQSHDWPGNVRELDNAIQRALILQPGPVIGAAHLSLDIFNGQMPLSALVSVEEPAAPALGEDLRRREYEIILEALRLERGCRQKVAEKLGISPRTLRYKLARMRESGLDMGALAGA